MVIMVTAILLAAFLLHMTNCIIIRAITICISNIFVICLDIYIYFYSPFLVHTAHYLLLLLSGDPLHWLHCLHLRTVQAENSGSEYL